MRKPTASEFKLILIFGLMIFLLANLILIKWYSATRMRLADQVSQLQQTAAEYRTLLAERPHWEARQQWVSAHPLEAHQGQASDSKFAEEVQQSLTRNGLAIDAQQIKDAEREGGLVQAQLELTAKGRLEQVLRWLNQVQQPGKHLIVQSFTLRRLDEGDTMVARVRLAKVFASTP